MESYSGARFIVSHVSGERMRSQGTDGVSRGNLKEIVSVGHTMLSFCPWHLSAIERNSKLKLWLQSWLGEDAEFLSQEDWFVRGHDILGGQYESISPPQNSEEEGLKPNFRLVAAASSSPCLSGGTKKGAHQTPKFFPHHHHPKTNDATVDEATVQDRGLGVLN